jgi:hypothetical protein
LLCIPDSKVCCLPCASKILCVQYYHPRHSLCSGEADFCFRCLMMEVETFKMQWKQILTSLSLDKSVCVEFGLGIRLMIRVRVNNYLEIHILQAKLFCRLLHSPCPKGAKWKGNAWQHHVHTNAFTFSYCLQINKHLMPKQFQMFCITSI